MIGPNACKSDTKWYRQVKPLCPYESAGVGIVHVQWFTAYRLTYCSSIYAFSCHLGSEYGTALYTYPHLPALSLAKASEPLPVSQQVCRPASFPLLRPPCNPSTATQVFPTSPKSLHLIEATSLISRPFLTLMSHLKRADRETNKEKTRLKGEK